MRALAQLESTAGHAPRGGSGGFRRARPGNSIRVSTARGSASESALKRGPGCPLTQALPRLATQGSRGPGASNATARPMDGPLGPGRLASGATGRESAAALGTVGGCDVAQHRGGGGNDALGLGSLPEQLPNPHNWRTASIHDPSRPHPSQVSRIGRASRCSPASAPAARGLGGRLAAAHRRDTVCEGGARRAARGGLFPPGRCARSVRGAARRAGPRSLRRF